MNAVSVVIPVYNGAAYLGAAIDSVLAQSVPAAEVFVAVDAASTDRSAAIAAGYGPPVTVVPVAPRAGTPATLNAGIARAAGAFLAFLDADDLWLPGKTAAQLAAFAARPELDAVFGHVRQFLSDDLPPALAARLHCPDAPMGGIAKQAMLVRRAAFERVGRFDETLRHVDFIDWYARAIDAGLQTMTLDDVVALRRIHAANTGVRERAAQYAGNLTALKRALDRRRRSAP